MKQQHIFDYPDKVATLGDLRVLIASTQHLDNNSEVKVLIRFGGKLKQIKIVEVSD